MQLLFHHKRLVVHYLVGSDQYPLGWAAYKSILSFFFNKCHRGTTDDDWDYFFVKLASTNQAGSIVRILLVWQYNLPYGEI